MAGDGVTRTSSIRRRLAWTVGILLLLVLTPALWILAGQHSMSADVTALHKMGVPTTFAELDAMEPNQGDNAAPLYIQAIRIVEVKPASNAVCTLDDVVNGHLSPKSQKARDAVKTLKQTADLSRDGSAMPRCVFPLGPDKYRRDDNWPYIGQMKLATALNECAIVESANGDTAAAFKDLSAVNNMARQLANSSGFLPFLNTTDEYRWAVQSWARCANDHSKDRAAVLQAIQWASNPPPLPNVRRTVASSFPAHLQIFESAISNPGEYQKARRYDPLPSMYANALMMRLAASQEVHVWRKVYASIPTDSRDWQMAKTVFQAASKPGLPWPASKIFVYNPFLAYTHTMDYVGCELAMERIAKQSAAVLLYRIDHSALPSALLLTGEDAIDPFSSKPLLYRKAGKGFQIYSVGLDGVDNGGSSMTLLNPSRQDIVMHFD